MILDEFEHILRFDRCDHDWKWICTYCLYTNWL